MVQALELGTDTTQQALAQLGALRKRLAGLEKQLDLMPSLSDVLDRLGAAESTLGVFLGDRFLSEGFLRALQMQTLDITYDDFRENVSKFDLTTIICFPIKGQ